MNFTYNWLKQYVDIDIPPAVVADHLTMLGLEVDTVEELYPDLSSVKVARVEAVHPHPNADKLVLCDVSVGEEKLRVVCGAPNVRAGMLTAIALPGAKLAGGFAVKPSKIRGEASEGMLCSEKELGISENHAGIIELPDNLQSGQLVAEALCLHDTFIEVDLTPNRPDCASVIGIAREVAGFAGKQLKPPVTDADLPKLTGEGVPFGVKVEAPDACLRYAARLLTNVKIAPSPWWLQQKLLAVGLRPINNVVDVTNYVMMEYGQPLHAFDYKKLAGGRIVVRHAKKGETITSLDGIERKLDEEMLLICDAEKPVAIAGVMGGQDSEVTGETTEILLESACFNPISVRRTASTLNLSTESSYRFERGVDPLGIPRALERAVQLIAELSGAEVVENGVDYQDGVKSPAPIALRVQRVGDLLGMTLSAEKIIQLLTGIEIKAEKSDTEILTVYPPSFRVDLEREIDLVEELARLTGYNEIPTSLPSVPMSFPEYDPVRDLCKKVTGVMTSLGFYEAINYSFVTAKHFDMLGLAAGDPSRNTVKLLNPLTEEQSVMRSSLLPGLLENVRWNINHQCGDVRLFEIGKVFFSQENRELPDEYLMLTAAFSGRRHPDAPRLYEGDAGVDIFDVKGAIEQILTNLRLPQVTLAPGDNPAPYAERASFRHLIAEGKSAGNFGKISPDVLKQFGIKQDVFFLDVNLDALVKLKSAPKVFESLPKFPTVQWDIAVLVPEHVPGGDILAAIDECREKLVEKAEIFDIYRGKNIDPGLKSVAISVTYRSDTQTLNDELVDKVHKKITDMILTRFEGRLREA